MTTEPLRASIFDYGVFGLKVRSELELPELFGEEQSAAPDVRITFGNAGAAVDATPGVHSDGDALILIVAEVARFRIAGGNSIVVEPLPGVPERNVRLFLLGSAFGALLHQRGLLPLHANAVEIDGKAVAFMGESGAGKSTLAAWFHDAGYRVLADDVCVIRFDELGRPAACPGLPRLRLWQDAIELTGRDSSEFNRSYVGDHPFEKFDVPIAKSASATDARHLGAVYVLDRGPALSIDRLDGIEAAEVIFAHTYRGGFLNAATGHRAHWAASVRVVQTTPVFRLTRPVALDRMDADGARILVHVRGGEPGP